MATTTIATNFGNVIIGDRNNIFICHCGHGCTSKIDSPQDPTYETNKVCSCRFSKQEKGDMDSLVNVIIGVLLQKNCPNFELHLKLKNDVTKLVEELFKGQRSLCNSSHGSNTAHISFGESEGCSEELEVKLSYPNQSSMKINNNIKVTNTNTMPRMKTNILTQLQQELSVPDSDRNFIQVKAKVDENGTKITFKLHLDVKGSAQRRCFSFSDVDNLKAKLKKNVKQTSSFRRSAPVSTMSNMSLSAASSSITIGEVSMDVADLSTIPAEDNECTDMHVDAPPPSLFNTEAAEDLQKVPISYAGSNTEKFDVEGSFKNKDAFAKGHFGPLYKIPRENKEMLVKVVGDNPKFLEEAKQFCNCTHPFVRPTAEVSVNGKSSYVMYRFVTGMSLYEAIQNNAISDYITYFRILFGIVKGLCYLREKQIECQFLTTEKVFLDTNFNPRICGVGLAYFDNAEHASTSSTDFHRSLSYLDKSLRSSTYRNPKNVMWSVGRIIWEMLLGKISQNVDEDLLVKYNIFEYLNEECDNKKIKTVYFSTELRKYVYAAGWPKDKEITKSLVVCAIRCMLHNLDKRISLNCLYNDLKTELCDLQKREKFALYQVLTDNFCIFCMKNERDHLALTCGCITACCECLKNVGTLYCPEHGRQYSKIGHPSTYGVIIQGDFHENQDICENDASAIEYLYTDQNIFGVKNFDKIKSRTEADACKELENVKAKIIEGEKAKKERYPSTLILFIVGHCNEAGNLELPDKSILKKKTIYNFIRGVNMKNVIVLCNGYYSEKLVKHLSTFKTNFLLSSNAFFGVFSHSGNLCKISHKNVCDKHSVTVRYILDILKKDELSFKQCRSSSRTHLTIGGLVQLVSDRMSTECGRCLKPIERNGAGHIPLAYL